MLLEIACFNIASAIAAAKAGADRIELCDNPAEGGTTPSYGTIKLSLDKINVPVFPIIRPRGGDFLYNDDEFSAMLYDVAFCRELGCKGVVAGLLKKDGSIDTDRTAQLVQAAGPMEVTFHRAFDRAARPLQALEDIIATGCKRLLTSGQQETAPQGKALIRQLVQQASGRVIVMPGSGVRSNNLLELQADTGAIEFHSSARMLVASEMEFNTGYWSDDIRQLSVDSAEIGTMKALGNAKGSGK